MIHTKAALVAFLALANTATVDAVLRGNRTPVDPTEELHMMMAKTRILKQAIGDTKTNKNNPTENPTDPETTAPTALPTGPPTTSPTQMPSMTPVAPPTASPTSQPTLLPTSKPSAAPIAITFDSTIEVICRPDSMTALSQQEVSAKTIICNSAKASCRVAVAAVKESEQLQNFFACAGDLGEAAARKLFNKYASSDILAGQLALIAATNPLLVTERPDAMKTACAAMAAMQSPAVADPCCQGSSGCTSVTGSASNSPPFMTIAITACTGDSACKDMGPNPLILDSSCTGTSACELMNENEINPSITGVTFVGEMACTTPQSCEGVGRRSHGDVIIQTGACVGSEACNSAARRVAQKGTIRIRSHIDIGANACVGINACKDAHSTVNYGTAGKPAGSLTIGAGSCAANGSCEKMGLNDRMRTDLVVPPGGCDTVKGCRGCMTKDECSPDEFYFISDIDGACPKGGISSGGNPTGDKVEEYCTGKDTLPTDSPTFSPTPFPTPLTSSPTSAPSNLLSQTPSDLPSTHPSGIPSALPSSQPSQEPTRTSSPTLPPASITVGCLSTPGDVTQTFNPITDDVLCDGATGTCAEFVSAVDALGENGKMIKSIFGCNDEDPPGLVTFQVAQERFDKIKNDKSVTGALLAIVNENKKLFTGSATVVTSACSDCCDDVLSCGIDPSSGSVMTVSSGSCTGGGACRFTSPNAIILDSCKGGNSCFRLGNFFGAQPAAGVEVGFNVIGPGACVAPSACSGVGVNIFGTVRVEEGACDGTTACFDFARRTNQGSTTTPVVANVFIGKNACKGEGACKDLHRFSSTKIAGDAIIEADACSGADTCNGLGNSDSATNDIIVKGGVCTTATPCQDCAQGSLCTPATKTYVIDDATADCPGPSPSACQEL